MYPDLNTYGAVDWGQPINWSHPLCRGLVHWWVAVPGRTGWGSATWFDLCRRAPLTMQGTTPASQWTPGTKLAYSFNGTNHYGLYSSPVLTGYPATLAYWGKVPSTAANMTALCITDKDAGSGDGWLLELRTGGTLRSGSAQTGTFSSADTTTTVSANTWYHHCGTYHSATDRRVFANGGGKGTNTTSSIPAAIDSVGMGTFVRGTPTGYFSGLIATAMAWNRAMSDDEVYRLYLEGLQNHRCMLKRIIIPRCSEQAGGAATTAAFYFNRYVLARGKA